jgi:N-acetylglucosaminyl-diphospho-decaprenol L-rhamnosyltransferase
MTTSNVHNADGASRMIRLSIIIVNYRTAELVIACLRSLADEVRALGDCRVVVVDGASGDDSVARIATAIQSEHWDSWVELMPLEKNLGFAAGNNAALRPLLASSSPPDYVLLLNPDTVVRPHAVRTLVEFMNDHPKVGIAGSRLENPNGTPQCSAFRFHSVLSELEGGLRLGIVSRLLRNRLVAPPVSDEQHATDWVAGASMIVRHAVFADIGLMDEAYFLYFEEVDFCLRARCAGWHCWYVPGSRVVHLVGQSSGVTGANRRARPMPRYWFDSRQRYFFKNHGRVYLWMTNVVWTVCYLLWQIRRRVQRKPDTDPPGLLWDFIRFNFRPSW